MSSPQSAIDRIIAQDKARRAEDEKKRREQQERLRELQRKTGTGEFAKGGSQDVFAERQTIQEAKITAQRELITERQKPLTARRGGVGTTRTVDPVTGRGTTRISGTRPVLTEPEISARAQDVVKRKAAADAEAQRQERLSIQQKQAFTFGRERIPTSSELRARQAPTAAQRIVTQGRDIEAERLATEKTQASLRARFEGRVEKPKESERIIFGQTIVGDVSTLVPGQARPVEKFNPNDPTTFRRPGLRFEGLDADERSFIQAEEARTGQKFVGKTDEGDYHFLDTEAQRRLNVAAVQAARGEARAQNKIIEAENEAERKRVEKDQDKIAEVAERSGYFVDRFKVDENTTNIALTPNPNDTSGKQVLILNRENYASDEALKEERKNYQTIFGKEGYVVNETKLSDGSIIQEYEPDPNFVKPKRDFNVGEQFGRGFFGYATEQAGGAVELGGAVGERVGLATSEQKEEALKTGRAIKEVNPAFDPEQPVVGGIGSLSYAVLASLGDKGAQEDLVRQREVLLSRPVEFASASAFEVLTFGVGARIATPKGGARGASRAPLRQIFTTEGKQVVQASPTFTTKTKISTVASKALGTVTTKATKTLTTAGTKIKTVATRKPKAPKESQASIEAREHLARLNRQEEVGKGSFAQRGEELFGEFQAKQKVVGERTAAKVKEIEDTPEIGSRFAPQPEKTKGGGTFKKATFKEPTEGVTGPEVGSGASKLKTLEKTSEPEQLKVTRLEEAEFQQKLRERVRKETEREVFQEPATAQKIIQEGASKFFRTPKAIKRIEQAALRRPRVVNKVRKTLQLIRKPEQAKLVVKNERDAIISQREALNAERVAIREQLERTDLTPGERAQLLQRLQEIQEEAGQLLQRADALRARLDKLQERIDNIKKRRELKRSDLLGAKQEEAVEQQTRQRKTQPTEVFRDRPAGDVATVVIQRQRTTPPTERLGFGGATGAERVRRRLTKLDEFETSIPARRPTDAFNVGRVRSTQQSLRGEELLGLRTTARGREGTRIANTRIQTTGLRQTTRVKEKTDDLLITTPIRTTTQAEITTTRTRTGTIQRGGFRQQTRTTPVFKTTPLRTTTRTRPIGFGAIPFLPGGGGEISAGVGKKSGKTAGKELSVANILFGELSIVGKNGNGDEQRAGAELLLGKRTGGKKGKKSRRAKSLFDF